MILFPRIVAKQHRRSVVDRNQHVHRAVVIEIAQSHAPRRQGLRKNRATLIADILKIITRIAKKQHGFAVRHARHAPFDMIIRVAIAKQQIQVTIVIKIKKLQSPTTEKFGRRRYACGKRNITKALILIVVVKRKHLLINICNEEIDPAILIVVGGIDSHPRTRSAIGAIADPGDQANFFKFPLAVGEETVGDRVVGNEQIQPAIVVDVAGDNAPCFGHEIGDACFLTYVGEGTVPIVAEQPAGHGIVDTRNAIPALMRVDVTTPLILGFAEIDEAADEEIEAAVIVVVEPDGAGSPSGGSDTGFCSDIGERAIAIVVIENAVAVLRDIKIRKSVAVIVTDSHAHAVRISWDASFFGDVRERTVPIVTVERITQRWIGIVEVTGATVHKIDIHPTVVVVIKESAASPGGLGLVNSRETAFYV